MSTPHLRPATLSDMGILFAWKNDSTVRASAFNTEPVTLEEHTRWFESALRNPDIRIYILEQDTTAIGQVRINKTDGVALIDYSIDKTYREKGFGKKLSACLRKNARMMIPSLPESRGEKKNIATRRVFERLEYTAIEKGEYMDYTKPTKVIGRGYTHRVIIQSSYLTEWRAA